MAVKDSAFGDVAPIDDRAEELLIARVDFLERSSPEPVPAAWLAIRSALRPEHALVAGQHGAHALVDELLQPLTFPGLGRVDVALGVGGDAVHAVELAGLASAVAEAGQDFHRLAQQDVDLLVAAVGDVEILLLRVFREGDVPHRPVGQRSLRDKLFLHKLALALEYL